jgi:hypothetical protein
MKFIDKLRTYSKVMRRRTQKGAPDQVRLLRQRPALLLGVAAFETAQMACSRVDARLKALAQIKTSALVGCPF